MPRVVEVPVGSRRADGADKVVGDNVAVKNPRPRVTGKTGTLDHKPRPFKRPRLEDRSKTLAAQEPWKKLGMSRRTWYRRQAEKKS